MREELVRDQSGRGRALLSGDVLFRDLVVQRSRAYVRAEPASQAGRRPSSPTATIPSRRLLRQEDLRRAARHGRAGVPKGKAALFARPSTIPCLLQGRGQLHHGAFEFVESRQKQVVGLIRTQFLKRFESSAYAFELPATACSKLLAFVTKYSETTAEKKPLERWKRQHKELIGYVNERQLRVLRRRGR